MKAILIFLFAFGVLNAQQTAQFRDQYFVRWNGANYTDLSGNILYRLTRTPNPTTTPKYNGSFGTPGAPGATPITINELSTPDMLGAVAAPQYAGAQRLYGDVKQSHDTLYFYIWPFTNAAPGSPQAAANAIFTANVFFMVIPPRTITGLRHNAWHIGALTLPAKVYVSSKVQLNDNTVFDVNIAGMVGKRWGRDNYYNLPNEEKGGSYTNAWSANFLFGITKIEVNGQNTTNSISESHSLVGATTGGAFGYHYGTLGVFVASGFDIPIGNNSQQWVFNGNPWVGVGLAIKLD